MGGQGRVKDGETQTTMYKVEYVLGISRVCFRLKALVVVGMFMDAGARVRLPLSNNYKPSESSKESASQAMP